MVRYDTVDLRALKSWRDGQLNLAHGPETKNNEKIEIKNRVAQKKKMVTSDRELHSYFNIIEYKSVISGPTCTLLTQLRAAA